MGDEIIDEKMNDTPLAAEVDRVRLLLCTNGSELTRPALEYGIWLADLLQLPVVLLGVVETQRHLQQVETLVMETASRLAALQIPCQVEYDRGRGSVVIARYTRLGNFITVVGPLGRPAWRRVVQGRSFRRLLAKIETPIVYVPKARLPVGHILLCLGGLGYAQAVLHLVIFLARAAGAHITLLHVVEPVNLDYPLSKLIEQNWDHILDTATPQGRNLRLAVEEIKAAGLEFEFKVRHGSIVHEILDELHGGEYDLIGMGSHYGVHNLRQMYLPDVTAEVAEELNCPVVTVRLGHELVSEVDIPRDFSA
jgi:nucleotide-binding universal stress UspA family protein